MIPCMYDEVGDFFAKVKVNIHDDPDDFLESMIFGGLSTNRAIKFHLCFKK